MRATGTSLNSSRSMLVSWAAGWWLETNGSDTPSLVHRQTAAPEQYLCESCKYTIICWITNMIQCLRVMSQSAHISPPTRRGHSATAGGRRGVSGAGVLASCLAQWHGSGAHKNSPVSLSTRSSRYFNDELKGKGYLKDFCVHFE